MEEEELQAMRYAGADLPGFRLKLGQELDYLLAIAMVKAIKTKV